MKTRQIRRIKLARLIVVSFFILAVIIYKIFKGEQIHGIGAHIWLLLFFIVLFIDLKYNNFYGK